MAGLSEGRVRYYVVCDGGRWIIQCDGENTEAYSSRVAAVQDAVALVCLDRRNGLEAAVIVQGDDNVFRALWDSSKLPPRLPEWLE